MGIPSSCGWINCKFDSFAPPPKPSAPAWFPAANAAPQPVNWDLQPNAGDNTCYGIPRGVGMEWQTLAMGCHNPRLDIDNIQCNYAVTDPNDPDFCTPENINVDYPPTNQWFRIAVHYYWNHDRTYAVHPEVKVFYNGAQFADLGPQGYYMPDEPRHVPAQRRGGPGGGQRLLARRGRGGRRRWLRPRHERGAAALRRSHPAHARDHARRAGDDGLPPPWPPPPQ